MAYTDTDVSPIRLARHRAGLTLDRLAVAAGISRGTLHLAERAPHLTSRRTAELLARVLKVKVDELLPRHLAG